MEFAVVFAQVEFVLLSEVALHHPPMLGKDVVVFSNS